MERTAFFLKLSAVFLILATPALAKDPVSYADLSSRYTLGKDYRIEIADRSSPFLVIAPHGGATEPGTLELGREIAGSDLSLYGLEAVTGSIHLTATKFDEPQALAMTAKSRDCIALHGFKSRGPQSSDVCIGAGANPVAQAKAKAIADAFKTLGWSVEFPCQLFPGAEPTNIVNRCGEMGVQLEFQWRETPVDRFTAAMADPAAKAKLAVTIRDAWTQAAPVVSSP